MQRGVELAECEESYDDLSDLMLMEQFVNRDEKSMVLFLKEHEVKTFDQMLKLADMYVEAHGLPGKKLSSEFPKTSVKDSSAASDSSRASKPNHVVKDFFHRYD